MRLNFLRLVSSLNNVDPSIRQSTSLLIVLLSILIPVAIICLLFIVLCWCCHQRNNNSHLSSCSTSSTPIKKSTHLVNTVTSSPFRSSILTTHPTKSHQRHFPPSSSSSANTNLTNAYLRQTLLRSEVKRPTLPIPLPNHSLTEISYSNIRFLQELGEGLLKKNIENVVIFHFFFSGEFGRISKGELIDNGSKCLIKSLQTDFANEQNREEFAREIESMSMISSLNFQ